MADEMPFQVLVAIFLAARDSEPVEFDHGGDLVHWDSNESCRTMALVCSSWAAPANFALYSSFCLLGGTAAELFLRTLQERPERRGFVKSLVLGLQADTDAAEDDAQAESKKLVEVLEACTNVQTLHIRPLHHSQRERLLRAIRSKSLRELVCLPRLESAIPFYYPDDLAALVTPSLECLELDFYSSPYYIPHPLPTFPTLALRLLRIFCSGDAALTFHLLAAAGPTLQVADLYFESVFDPTATVAAFAPSTLSLVRCAYVTNPSNSELSQFVDPPFDRLLPHFTHLESLSLAATEVSTRVFRLLPSSLRHLAIQSFNDAPTFRSDPALIEALEDEKIDFQLETFELRDETWSEEEVGALAKACAARGIEFRSLAE